MNQDGYLLGFFTKCAQHGLGCAEALQLLEKVAAGNTSGKDGSATPFAGASSTAGVKNPTGIPTPSIGAIGKGPQATPSAQPMLGSRESVTGVSGVPDLTNRNTGAVQVPVPPGDTGGPAIASGAAVPQSTSGMQTSPAAAGGPLAGMTQNAP